MEMPVDGWDTMLCVVRGGGTVEIAGLFGVFGSWCCMGGGAMGANEKGVSHEGRLEVSSLSRVTAAGGNVTA